MSDGGNGFAVAAGVANIGFSPISGGPAGDWLGLMGRTGPAMMQLSGG